MRNSCCRTVVVLPLRAAGAAGEAGREPRRAVACRAEARSPRWWRYLPLRRRLPLRTEPSGSVRTGPARLLLPHLLGAGVADQLRGRRHGSDLGLAGVRRPPQGCSSVGRDHLAGRRLGRRGPDSSGRPLHRHARLPIAGMYQIRVRATGETAAAMPFEREQTSPPSPFRGVTPGTLTTRPEIRSARCSTACDARRPSRRADRTPPRHRLRPARVPPLPRGEVPRPTRRRARTPSVTLFQSDRSVTRGSGDTVRGKRLRPVRWYTRVLHRPGRFTPASGRTRAALADR